VLIWRIPLSQPDIPQSIVIRLKRGFQNRNIDIERATTASSYGMSKDLKPIPPVHEYRTPVEMTLRSMYHPMADDAAVPRSLSSERKGRNEALISRL
jgi:hypothetical protein